MENHYKILEVAAKAEAGEIKRAYYKKVREYPPECFPDEFKKLRQAYEILSDSEKREIYDKNLDFMADIPEEAATMIDAALKAAAIGLIDKAEDILKKAEQKFPNEHKVAAAQAKVYYETGKFGTSIKIWRNLCDAEPDNADFSFCHANSLAERGWRKKALAEYERTLGIDETIPAAWVGLLKCYNEKIETNNFKSVCKRAEAAAKGMGDKKLSLYLGMSLVMIEVSGSVVEKYLKDAVKLMRECSEVVRKKNEKNIVTLLDAVITSENYQWLPYIREMADMIDFPDKIFSEMLAKAAVLQGLHELKANEYSEIFHDLLACINEGCNCDSCKCEIAFMEYLLLKEIKKYRPLIMRLKNEYPKLYDLHSRFFDEVTEGVYLNKMKSERLKVLKKVVRLTNFFNEANIDISGRHGSLEDAFDELDFDLPIQETYRREGEKIGRNDPCPCGSGKKYKKCCGV